ncbi:MAG: hypothetical protein GX608_04050 [Lentisphaerae bacterium]|nr:hypothetical protein [Lentisphaerota bacterium]
MGGDLPADLDDVLSYVSILGTSAGWERIQQEAQAQSRSLAFPTDKLSAADLVMKAWLWEWPTNKSLLEESYSRARIHARSSFDYFLPVRDVRDRYQAPSDRVLDEIRQELTTYFVGEGLGKGTSIVRFEYECEIWFLIRYPGRLKRQVKIDDDGVAENLSFKPEEYDAVVYHKEYGDLRMNTNRDRDKRKYRIVFGHSLLASENLFSPDKRVITLEPLKGQCLHLFDCADIHGLAEIAPVEMSFHGLFEQGRRVVLVADEHTTLLSTNKLAPFLVQVGTDSIHHAIFRYRLRNRTKYEKLTVRQGNTMTYERDGDSAVLEQWLRARGFIVKSGVRA